MPAYLVSLWTSLLAILPALILAIIVFIVGLIIASLLSSLTRQLLRRTHLDERIAGMMGGGEKAYPENVHIDNIAARIVYWLIVFFTVVAVLQILNLNAVSGPFAPVLAFIPRLISGAILFVVAWLIATILRAVTTRVLNSSSWLRNATENASMPPENRMTIGQTIGNVVYWLVLLLFLPAILGALQIQGILGPVQTMVNNILAYLPNILAAAIIFTIGYFAARIVRQILVNVLAATGLDNFGRRTGMGGMADTVRLSDVIGWLAFILILIPTTIAALNALNIPAVSTPASNMLNQILVALPNIFAAAVILAVAYFIGRVLGTFVAELLDAVHFNQFFIRMGLYSESAAQRTVTETTGEVPSAIVRVPTTPSRLVGYLVTAGIVLFAILEASQFLGFTFLATLVSAFITAAFQVIIGLVIFGIGLFLSSLADRAIRDTGMTQANILGPVARAVIIVFSAALGLRQMGIADSIVNLAFGLLLGAIAVAAAIAFGLGGRDFAHRQLEHWEDTVTSNAFIPISGKQRDEHHEPGEHHPNKPGEGTPPPKPPVNPDI